MFGATAGIEEEQDYGGRHQQDGTNAAEFAHPPSYCARTRARKSKAEFTRCSASRTRSLSIPLRATRRAMGITRRAVGKRSIQRRRRRHFEIHRRRQDMATIKQRSAG